jgi:hypothetical protein
MGVDWNSYLNGGQIVLVEYCRKPTFIEYIDDETQQEVRVDCTGKYRIFYRVGIRAKNATQRLTRAEIIRLLTYYKIDYVYVDYGAGDTNIEELSFYGQQHPELGLSEKLKVVDSGATIEHYDPIARQHVKKRNKSMMINTAVLNCEEGRFILPKEEDEKVKLIGQMRGYRIKNVTSRGEFSYEGADHILDAFHLAIYGFQLQFGHLLTSKVDYRIGYAPPKVTAGRDKDFKNYKFGKNSRNVRDPEKTANRVQVPRRISPPKMGGRSLNFRKSKSRF